MLTVWTGKLSIENLSIQEQRSLGLDARKSPKAGQINESFITTGFMFLEMAVIFALGYALAHFYVGNHLGVADYYPIYITPILLVPVLAILRFKSAGLYEMGVLQRSSLATGEIARTLAGIFIGLLIVAFLASITGNYSRIWFTGWAISSLSTILILRGLLDQLLTRLLKSKIPINRIAIVGDVDSAKKVYRILAQEGAGTEILGLYGDRCGKPQDPALAGSIKDLITLAQSNKIDRIVIAKDVANPKEISKLSEKLSILPSEVLMFPTFLKDNIKLSGLASLSHTRLLRIQQRPISEFGLLAKSAMDGLIALLALIVLSPIMLIAAIGIKLDSPGPVFFRQTRHGYNQQEISVWKFRTMKVMENGPAFRQAVKGDKRITRFGAFLRRTSIDELPQLFNVLRGEMSIVGPRPHPVAMNSDLGAKLRQYDNRHKVKPGITGLAQINGYRGPTTRPEQIQKRIEYDLEYIENWSLWLDLKIIIATPFFGLFSKNAF